jgi:hypothetical protein
LPDTVTVLTCVPPVVQTVGAVACGPKTVKVIVPVGMVPDPNTEMIEVRAIALPDEPVPGPTIVSEGVVPAGVMTDTVLEPAFAT